MRNREMVERDVRQELDEMWHRLNERWSGDLRFGDVAPEMAYLWSETAEPAIMEYACSLYEGNCRQTRRVAVTLELADGVPEEGIDVELARRLGDLVCAVEDVHHLDEPLD